MSESKLAQLAGRLEEQHTDRWVDITTPYAHDDVIMQAAAALREAEAVLRDVHLRLSHGSGGGSEERVALLDRIRALLGPR